MTHRREFLAGLTALYSGKALAQVTTSGLPLQAMTDGGTVALIRHAVAPGTGDPPGFRLGDCSTQRDLSEAGRRQAVKLGRKLREAGVLVTHLRSSRWCRALSTARLAFPNLTITPDAALDSFFGEDERRQQQTEQLRAQTASWYGRQGTLALVTHQINITALTDVVTAEGEIVVLRPTSDVTTEIVGRLRL